MVIRFGPYWPLVARMGQNDPSLQPSCRSKYLRPSKSGVSTRFISRSNSPVEARCAWGVIIFIIMFQEKLHKYKITSAYPSLHQIRHDIFVTLSASCCAAGLEVFMCHKWAQGTKWISFDRQMDPWALKSILVGASVTFWRIAHFHCLHRGMHPWVSRKII